MIKRCFLESTFCMLLKYHHKCGSSQVTDTCQLPQKWRHGTIQKVVLTSPENKHIQIKVSHELFLPFLIKLIKQRIVYYKIFKLERFPNSSGNWPMRELLVTLKNTNSFKWPSSLGNSPQSSFDWRSLHYVVTIKEVKELKPFAKCPDLKQI